MPTLKSKQGRDREVEQKMYLKSVEYLQMQKQIKDLTKKKDALNAELKQLAAEHGTENSDEDLVVKLRMGTQRVTVRSALRVKAVLKDNAAEILQEKGYGLAVETIEVVNEDILQGMILNEMIPQDVVDDLYVTTESRALYVENK